MDKRKDLKRYRVSLLLKDELLPRYDVCSCPSCKSAMLEQILFSLPPNYLNFLQKNVNLSNEEIKASANDEIKSIIKKAIESINRNPLHKTRKDTEERYHSLLKKIYDDRLVDFRFCYQDLIKKQIQSRMNAIKALSYAEYLEFLIKNTAEYDNLFEPFSLYSCEFFRDPEVWITIKYCLENILRNKTKDKNLSIRIWSASCAYGEESFSMAILLRELLGYEIKNFITEIYGTETNPECLEFIKVPEYSRDNLKNMDRSLRVRYFDLNGFNYTLKNEVKKMVRFMPLDLLKSEIYIKDTDVIICRNAFTYLSLPQQRNILAKFHKSLKPNGYLILGKPDRIIRGKTDLFLEMDNNAHIYKKI